MSKRYLVVSSELLPKVIDKVARAKALVEQKKVRGVSEAVKQIGISRSSYYKYVDHVITLEQIGNNRQFTLSMTLADTPGVLSAILTEIATCGFNVNTIEQTAPENEMAIVHILIASNQAGAQPNALINSLQSHPGVLKVNLLFHQSVIPW